MTTIPETDLLDASHATIVDPDTVADLMVALERMFKIGVYYPSGHAVRDQAAEGFLAALAKVVRRARSLRFAWDGEHLTVQGFMLDPGQRGVPQLQEYLVDLGITTIEFDPRVTAAELHQFVTRMLALRTRVKGALEFQQIVIDGLPATVSVSQRSFRAREVQGGLVNDLQNGDDAHPTIEVVLQSMQGRGLEPDEIERCRLLLEQATDHLHGQGLDGAALPQVTWTDIQTLLERAVRHDKDTPAFLRDRPPAMSDLNVLSSIFAALNARSKDGTPHQGIDLLLTIAQREESARVRRGTAAPVKVEAVLEGPADDLKSTIAAIAPATAAPAALAAANRCEIISILMQMLARDQKPATQLRIQKELRDMLRAGVHADERAVVVAGLRNLLALGGEERLHGALRIVLEALRTSSSSSPLRMLDDVAQDQSNVDTLVLWPAVVNELLLFGGRRDPEAFATACALAARPSPAEMQALLPRLEALEALRDHRCARDVFMPPATELFPVFAVLLHSPHAAFIGGQLIGGLRFKPLSWVSEATIPLLAQFRPQHRRFLIDLLKLGTAAVVPPAMAERAGRILAESLPELPRESRNQPWVEKAILATARLPVANADTLLHGIVRARHHLFFHEWPEASRRAARQALATRREATP